MQSGRVDVHLDGYLVLVTGGTSGIGRGIAEAFLASGATVVVCGRKAPGVLPADGARSAQFIACDVRDADAVERLIAQIESQHGRLDVLVNNAGGSPSVDAATAPPQLTEKIIQLNLVGPFHCAQAANRVMQRQETGGAIINIASVAGGVRPAPTAAAYGAAKAGLLSATESLAMEWGPKVRVNAVIVGLAATEHSKDHYGGPEGVRRIAEMLPLKRMAEPADVAAVCLFLASPLAAYVSGARVAVHGGGERPVFLYLADK
jgi:NAD(P)-dependent dehydrogenase (short-subunit alcohol dehydrogenase family)